MTSVPTPSKTCKIQGPFRGPFTFPQIKQDTQFIIDISTPHRYNLIMTIARSEIVQDGVEAVYHIVSRCVRRAFLCGDDPYTGKSFEHRKQWVRDRLKILSESFAIEICAYAIMSNHLHVVIRTRPDWAEGWSPEEIARRWLAIFPKTPSNKTDLITDAELKSITKNARLVKTIRERLGSVSWFARCLNEFIARRANKEDECKGRFWEGRFKCQAILDDSACLACMAYVDLNPVRAGLAECPEQSAFTSIHDRISSFQQHGPHGERTIALPAPPSTPKSDLTRRPSDNDRASWLCPIRDGDIPGRRGVLPISLEEYINLVDSTGRILRPDKPGSIPEHLNPILERLRVEPEHWQNTVTHFGRIFYRAAGARNALAAAARRAGRKWFKGLDASQKAFSEA